MERNKIVYIITRLDKGGSAENVIDICDRMNSEKYEVILIYGKGSRPLRADYRVFYVPELVRNISLFKDIIAFWKIYCLIKKIKPDIVHTHTSKAGFVGRWATWLLRTTKIVHNPHGHIFYGYYGKLKTALFVLLERLTAKITDKLIALTDGERNESLAFGVGKSHQWSVIHSGVELKEIRDKRLEIRKKLNIPENSIIIGTVARLDPIKGIKYFVEAIPLLTYFTTLTFLIVGDGSEKKSLEFRVESLGIKGKVIFTGMRDDVSDLISIMDIYVQPSLNEGMGKTIVQAMMLGKPIIATNVQGIPSLIKDGERGILVPSKNSQAIADAIKKLLSNKEISQKVSANAKKWSTEIVDGYPRFSVERQLYLLNRLYENI